jgi:SAM-dependent methyltransferase
VNAPNTAITNGVNRTERVYVQYGCGQSCPAGWENFDASPTLYLQKMPIVGSLFRRGAVVFPRDVRFGDIVKGLPLADGTVDGIYASHVLEHLPLSDFQLALENTFRLLKPGGVFRLVVPDLESRAKKYLEKLKSGEPESSSWFMRASSLGAEHRRSGLSGLARAIFGNSAHLWMWDEGSMTSALKKVGFVDIRRASFNDSGDGAFLLVEEWGRFFDAEVGAGECAVEARKPRSD